MEKPCSLAMLKQFGIPITMGKHYGFTHTMGKHLGLWGYVSHCKPVTLQTFHVCLSDRLLEVLSGKIQEGN